MKSRKFLFIILGVLIVSSLIILVAIMLRNAPQTPGIQPPPSASYPNGVVDPNDPQLQKYTYALVNSTDNIKLKTELGEELLINLERKNWRDIKWSKEGSNVAVLGETKPDIFNLFLYDLNEKRWIQITNFETTGVTSYDWVDDDTILFTEGGWLHRYKYSTISEVLKINQIDATLISISPNRSTIIMQDEGGTFYVLSIEGKLLFTLNRIGFDGGEGFIIIQRVYYSKDSETLLFLTQDNRIFSWNLGDASATEVSLTAEENSTLSSANIMCSVEVDKFTMFSLSDLMLDFYSLDLIENELTNIASDELEFPISEFNFNCSQEDTKILFNIVDEEGIKWYQLEDAEIEKLVILDEAKFLDFRNSK